MTEVAPLRRLLRRTAAAGVFRHDRAASDRLIIEETRGNVTQAARLLGIDRNAPQRRIEKKGVNPPEE